MSGTYNEVQVKKLGQKKAKKVQKAAVHDSSHQYTSGASSYQHQTHHDPYNPQNGNDPGQDSAAWPQTLSDFVNRSFEQSNELNNAGKAIFNEQIQSLIYSAARDKKIWTNDWTRQRLPVFDPSVPPCLYQDIPGVMSAVHMLPHDSEPQQPHTQQKRSKKAKYDSQERKKQRAERFQDCASPAPASPGPKSTQIIGTSTALEKRYLRLTSEPDPCVVRPENVLEKCLKHVVEKYCSTGASYSYINDQLKAIRQDMTVQHIKSDLALSVYETHGRIAIENNDLGEFNQCQAQLKHLYAQKDPEFYKNTYEFTCYRVLYLLLTGNYADINLTRLELMDLDAGKDLSVDFETRRMCVYNALKLADYVTLGDYSGFFALYKWYQSLDCMDGAFHLLEQFMANKQRVLSLNTMCKAFKKLPLSYLEKQFALDSAALFLADFGLSDFVSGPDFDCAAAKFALQAIVDQGKFKKVDIKGQV
ncbi:hypothetical protein OXX80_010245 [Metschnikowia pulcherrima]